MTRRRRALPHLTSLTREARDEALGWTPRRGAISRSTRTRRRAQDYTLAGVIDRSATSMGARELRRWLNRPIRDREELQRRHRRRSLHYQGRRYDGLRELLRGIGDLERVLASVALRSARPRDLAPCARGSRCCRSFSNTSPGSTRRARAAASRTARHADEPDLLRRALVETPPALLRDGGVIAPGYDAELDELRTIATDADQYLLELEERERERTGIAQLKVGYNRVHGFYIEMTAQPVRARARRLHPPADAQERRALHHARAQAVRGQGARRARARAGARARAVRGLLEQLGRRARGAAAHGRGLAALDVLANLAERAVSLR